MKSAFITFLMIAFVGVFAVKASDFHCPVTETHQSMDHQAAHHEHDGDKQEPCHDHCPPHMHSCCTTVYVFQATNQIDLPAPAKVVFSENVYLLKPAPVLEGPFQPPRLS